MSDYADRERRPMSPVRAAPESASRSHSRPHVDLKTWLRDRRELAGNAEPVSEPPGPRIIARERGAAPPRAPEASEPPAMLDEPGLDHQLRAALDSDGIDGALLAAIAPLDGTERRALARRLATYRPGSGDDIGARFVRLDHATRERILTALRTPHGLPSDLKNELEGATGVSLSHVRVHSDHHGAAVAAQHGARAVAIGDDIYLGDGQLESSDRRALIAHEVAHVRQAAVHAGAVVAAAKRDADSTAAAEQEADVFAAAFVERGAAARFAPTVSVGARTPMRAPATPQPHAAHRASPATKHSAAGDVFTDSNAPFQIVTRGVWVVSEWVRTAPDAASTDDGHVVAPSRARAILNAWGFVEPARLETATRRLVFPPLVESVQFVQLAVLSLTATGLPAGQQWQVQRDGDDLDVVTRDDDPALVAGTQVAVPDAQRAKLVRALIEFTGLAPDSGAVAMLAADPHRQRVEAGNGVLPWKIDPETGARLFGEERYRHWLHGSLDPAPVPVAPKLALRNFFQCPVPGVLSADRAVVESGYPAWFEVGVAWPTGRLPDGQIYDVPARSRRGHAGEVAPLSCDWTFTKLGLVPTVEHYTSAIGELHYTPHLLPSESSAQFLITVTARFSEYFESATFARTFEVKSTAAAIASLNATAFGDLAPASQHTERHQFESPLYGSPSDIDGTKTVGPLSDKFVPTGSPGSESDPRAASRASDRARLEAARMYLAAHGTNSADAIAATDRELARMADSEAALAADRARGWQAFEIRGSYLSREDGVPSGSLSLYGTVHVGGTVGGVTVFEVAIRDLSRRFDNKDMRASGVAGTFDAALQLAFFDLVKAYPAGVVSVMAEQIDEAAAATGKGTPGTGKAVGFSLGTGSSWKRAEAAVWAPAVTVAVNLGATALMAFAPALAPVVMPLLVAYNAAPAVDRIATEAARGTLTSGTVALSVGEIALNVLPMVGSAKPFTGGWFIVETANWGGQAVLMTASAVAAAHQLQAADVAQLASLYERLQQVEASGASPQMVESMRAEVLRKAAQVSTRIDEQLQEQVASGAVFALSHSMVHRIAGMAPVEAAALLHAELPGPGLHREVESAADEVDHRGLMIAGQVGGVSYRDGAFHVKTTRGETVVEVKRTVDGDVGLRPRDADWVIEVPGTLNGIDLVRGVAGRLTEIQHTELLRAGGHAVAPETSPDGHSRGESLSPSDMRLVTELRIVREQAERAVDETERRRATRDADVLEAQLGLRDGTELAAKRRRTVEADIIVQNDSPRRYRAKTMLDGEVGHPGIELHSHFLGVASAEVFRARAATAMGGKDTGTWIPLLERIAALHDRPNQPGQPAFDHVPNEEGRIATRATAGDAVAIARVTHDQVIALRDRARAEPNEPAFLRAAELAAEEACRVALAASPETDFNSAYEIRDELIKQTFGAPTDEPRLSPETRKQRAYDDFIRETILELARTGVRYSEQSTSANKLDGVLNPQRIQAQIDALIAEGLIKPGQVDIRMLPMIHTGNFGDRDPALPPIASPVRDDDAYRKHLDTAERQIADPMVVGSDVGGMEQFDFNERGRTRFVDLYRRHLTEANAKGVSSVFRPHVGEGAVDTEAGAPFHTDHDRATTATGELSHYPRARNNIDVVLDALDELRASGELDAAKVVVRLGHVTHATPEQAARMKALGVMAEVNLGSNVATGALSQTKGAHGARSPVEQLDDHSFLTLLYYDVPIAISTDGSEVMNTTLPKEYARAHQLIEELLRVRTVRVRASEAVAPDGQLRGRAVAGEPDVRELAFAELDPDEQQLFLHAYEKLYADAERYYQRRPKPRGTPSNPVGAESPFGGDHHVSIAARHGLVPSKGTSVYEGVRADVDAAAAEYGADKRYLVTTQARAGGVVVVEVTARDGGFEMTLRSWSGDGPAYLPANDPGALDQPRGNGEIRRWYHDQLQRIATLDASWKSEGLPLEERARRAFEVRRSARAAAREQMQSAGEVAVLQLRDLDLHGDVDGVSFEDLVGTNMQNGMSREQALEAIIGSSKRSNADYDQRNGITETKP